MEQTWQGLAHFLVMFSFFPMSNGKPLEGSKRHRFVSAVGRFCGQI